MSIGWLNDSSLASTRSWGKSVFYPAIVGARSYLGAGVSMPDDHTKVFGDLPKWFLTMVDGDAEMSF